jgi:hypothetical protein
MNWIPAFLKECRSMRALCMSPGCTTCGAGEFRRRLLDRAAIEGRVEGRDGDHDDWAGDGVGDAAGDAAGDATGDTRGDERSEAIARGFRLGLLGLQAGDQMEAGDCGVEIMLAEARGFQPDLETLLEGTIAGDLLAAIRDRAAAVARRRDRYQREMATAERAGRARRRRRVWERRTSHEARLEAKQQRDDLLELVVASFARLDPVDRLKWLAKEDLEIPIDRIPEDLLPIETDPIVLLDVERIRLINRIGGRRRKWRLLRINLELVN